MQWCCFCKNNYHFHRWLHHLHLLKQVFISRINLVLIYLSKPCISVSYFDFKGSVLISASLCRHQLKVWNHDFFWESMKPGGGEMPTLGLLQQIEKDFGSFENFKEKFIEAALTSFGSCWVWLACKSYYHLSQLNIFRMQP